MIEHLYNDLPANLQKIIKNYGPEKLSSLMKTNIPYVDSFLQGVSYLPYYYLGSAAASILLRIKNEDYDWEKIAKGIKLGYGVVSWIGPIVEESLFRYLPSVVGKHIGGDVGEVALVGASTLIWSLIHLDYYKNKIKGLKEVFLSPFFIHSYLTGGFFASLGLHVATNHVGYATLKYKLKSMYNSLNLMKGEIFKKTNKSPCR